MSANPDIIIEIKTNGGATIVRVHTGWLDLADLRKLQGWLNGVIGIIDPPPKREKAASTSSAQALGGHARAAAMTPEARSETARKAANARWSNPASRSPDVTHRDAGS